MSSWLKYMWKCPPVSQTVMSKLRQNKNYKPEHIEIIKPYSEIREYIRVIMAIVIRKLSAYRIAVVLTIYVLNSLKQFNKIGLCRTNTNKINILNNSSDIDNSFKINMNYMHRQIINNYHIYKDNKLGHRINEAQ